MGKQDRANQRKREALRKDRSYEVGKLRSYEDKNQKEVMRTEKD